jgi:glyoxylase-like metal-dependent hydrolase (beta-lactamase superfamily II)
VAPLLEIPGHDIVGITADNPGPLTLSGTNSWVVGRDPAWLVDPGPALPGHLDALAGEIARRGGLGGLALTHDHLDHCEGLAGLLEHVGDVPVGSMRRWGATGRPSGPSPATVTLTDGDRFGPLEAIATPGHATDHLAFGFGSVVLSGDAVLGEGSVFIAPDPGALRGYLDALQRLRARHPTAIGPGHGPVILEPDAKLSEYIAHRLAREVALVEALAAGRRTVADLLDFAWADVPENLRGAAAVTLAAHLDKLRDEGRLPDGVQRPGLD